MKIQQVVASAQDSLLFHWRLSDDYRPRERTCSVMPDSGLEEVSLAP